MPNIFLAIAANEHFHLVGAVRQGPNTLDEFRLGEEAEAMLAGFVRTADQISKAAVVAEDNATILHTEADDGGGNDAVEGLNLLISLLQLQALLLLAVIKRINQSTNNSYKNAGKAGGLQNLNAGTAGNELIGNGKCQVPIRVVHGGEITHIHGHKGSQE